MKSFEDPLPEPGDADAILAFLAPFEREGFVPSTLVDRPGVFPWDDKAPEVRLFLDAVYAHGFVRPFDWSSWGAQARAFFDDPERLSRADLCDVVRLLTYHVRQDRFCDGHLSEMIRCGHVAAILRRLARIREGWRL